MAELVNLNPEVAEQLRRGRADEVCIEKLLKTLACVADGGSQQCFNLMGQRGGLMERLEK